MTRTRTAALVALVALSSAALGCARGPSRTWRPEDHDSGVVSGATPQEAPTNDDPLAAGRAVFAGQCASCHGVSGRGDGPMAAMFRPADLTAAAWQASRTDAEIAAAITQGRGRMPAFGAQLRPEAVSMLVRLIRSWRQ
jgi:mono/diheme cytochrome c family protein